MLYNLQVAEQLSLERKGPQHQAGSDSLLTGETFFKLREIYFEDNIEENRYSGFIYGLKIVERGVNGLGTVKGLDGDHDDSKFSPLDGQSNGANGSNGSGNFHY